MKKIYNIAILTALFLAASPAFCQENNDTKEPAKEYIKELSGGLGDTIPDSHSFFHRDSILAVDIRCESSDFKSNCNCNIDSAIVIYKNTRQIDINFCKNARPVRITPSITKLHNLKQLIMVDVKVDENTYPANFGELDSLTYLSAFVVNDKIPTQFFNLKSIDYLSLEYSQRWIDEAIFNDILKLAQIKSLKRLIIWNLKMTPKKRENLKAHFLAMGIVLSI